MLKIKPAVRYDNKRIYWFRTTQKALNIPKFNCHQVFFYNL